MSTTLVEVAESAYVLASAPSEGDRECVRGYCAKWARSPDRESEFKARVEPLLGLNDDQLFGTLIRSGYEGLFLFDDTHTEIIGHVFYQKHPGWWGIFHVFTKKELRQQGYATRMVVNRLNAGWSENLGHMMISKGNDERVRKIHAKIVAPENPLGLTFRVRPGAEAGSVLFIGNEK